MPITGTGWELHVERLAVHVWRDRKRTYGRYQVYRNGQQVARLTGYVCESPGPGDLVRDSGHRIVHDRYPLSTQFEDYVTVGYSEDMQTAGARPMPAILLANTAPRTGILIHPGHPRLRPGSRSDLYLSSVGCLNPTGPLNPSEKMDFWDSRRRVIALIDDLRAFAPAAFRNTTETLIDGAWAVIEGEPDPPPDA